MLGEGGTPLEKLQASIGEFQLREERCLDLKGLRSCIDALEGEFAAEARSAKQARDHVGTGSRSAVSWIAWTCGMSGTSAADRLCVGEQLDSLPKVAAALRTGEIGYQSAALLCHLRDQLGDKHDRFNEDEMLEMARKFTVGRLRYVCRYARHCADPDGFFKEAEEDYSRRRLSVSQMSDGMHFIEGILDPEGGAALRTALESLAKRLGPDDDRTHRQRMADALVECMRHAMDEGKLPRRNGVKPHVTVTTTLEGLKNELGAPAADLELSLPISTRNVERLACDCTMSRVLLADSMVIDVGRATRSVTPPQWRALRIRDKGCRFPGCDRQVNWTSPHHIEFWGKGGPGNLANLLLLCFFHHRLVHEGGWQVVKVGREFRFVPPESYMLKRPRGPGLDWAA